MEVRIGVTQVPKEIEVDLGEDIDRDAVVKQVDEAISVPREVEAISAFELVRRERLRQLLQSCRGTIERDHPHMNLARPQTHLEPTGIV